MAGRSQTALVGALLSGLVLVAPGASAQPVPLPPPAPQPKTGTLPPPPSSAPATRPGATAPASGPFWLPPFLGGRKEQPAPGTSTAFDPAQRAVVDKVSAYLSNVRVLSGDFTQIAPDGRQSKGQFFIQKPGKVRFEYEPPARIDIIADGSSVVVRDRKLATQDVFPLSQTPLRYLLQDRIDLLKDTNVVGVYADDSYLTIVIEEKQVVIGTSRLMMMFGAKDLVLKQWVVTDPQGFDTTVAVSNLDSARRPDPNLFKIDYTVYPQ